MSDINLQWLVDNFSDRHAVFFDIGCADVGGDSLMFKTLFPLAQVYAFECASYWKEHNIEQARLNGIHYFHIAIADHCNGVTFYPSENNHENEQWPWSGSMYAPGEHLNSVGLKFGESYTVPSTTLNMFCDEHNVTPNFIHIDAQGAEHAIFKNMNVRPEAIWAEISEFHLYDTGVTYDDFNQMMLSYGYEQKYLDNHDTLYVHSSMNFTAYNQPNK